MADTDIEWATKVWNVTRGCSRVSDECSNCYAMGQAHRFSNAGGPYHELTVLRPKTAARPGVDWSGQVRFATEILAAPLRWRSPQRVFVNSMSDLFHHGFTFEQIATVFGVMAACPHHTFLVLTKRPARALEFFEWLKTLESDPYTECHHFALMSDDESETIHRLSRGTTRPWPLPNVHLGVSAGTQKSADEFVPLLMRCPAAVRWVSVEPMIERVDISRWVFNRGEAIRKAMNGPSSLNREQADSVIAYPLDWFVVGGESGSKARPCDVDWVRTLVEQCKSAAIACFVKQLGARPVEHIDCDGCSPTAGLCSGHSSGLRLRHPKGGDPSEWPTDLRVREFPEVRT